MITWWQFRVGARWHPSTSAPQRRPHSYSIHHIYMVPSSLILICRRIASDPWAYDGGDAVPGWGTMAPFDICAIAAAVDAVLLLTLWNENYGDVQVWIPQLSYAARSYWGVHYLWR
jgi:hypothetical protein